MTNLDGYPYNFEYELKNRTRAVCEIRLYEHLGKQVLIASDAGVGESVTNNVECLATALRRIGVQWDLFIDHYSGYPEQKEYEMFEIVIFTWQGQLASNPRWCEISQVQLEIIIGRNFGRPS